MSGHATRPTGRVLMPIAYKQRPIRHRDTRRPAYFRYLNGGGHPQARIRDQGGVRGRGCAFRSSSAAVPDAKTSSQANRVTNNYYFYEDAISTYRFSRRDPGWHLGASRAG